MALPLLLSLLKPPSGPPTPSGNLDRVENNTRTISDEVQGLYGELTGASGECLGCLDLFFKQFTIIFPSKTSIKNP